MKMETVDKVDMSLDDIIKLNRKEAKASSKRGRGQGRGGRGGRATLRGLSRGRSPVKGRGPNMFNRMMRGRRGMRGGRGGRGAGRGRGANISGVSPLNRSNNSLSPKPQQTNRGRGARGRQWTSTQRGAPRGRRGTNIRFQQKRQKAIDTLIKAKSTLAKLNAQRRKNQRLNIVNRKRGLTTSSNMGSTLSLNSVSSRGTGRMSSYGSTISLVSTGSGKQKRRWRQSQSQLDANPVLTISVNNPVSSPPSPVRRGMPGRGGRPMRGGRGGRRKNFLKRLPVDNNDSDPMLAEQIKNLRPAISQKYNFKKAVFSQAHTSLSLSDRFRTERGMGEVTQEGRKVFF